MNIILGIDPGSRITGYGVIKVLRGQGSYICSGVIRTRGDDMPSRLKDIFEGLSHIIKLHQPDCLSIEQVFMHKNASSALKLGHARGAAMLAGSIQNLPVHEYSPRQIKQAVVGYGGAEKAQVQHMVTQLLSLSDCPAEDAADALAVALCHSANQRTQSALLAAQNKQ